MKWRVGMTVSRRTGKECRVDLPSLRVERGSSEDVVVPRQATQAIYIKVQVGGKLTKEKVTRMLREKKLSEPAEIRFMVYRPCSRAAVKVDTKFLSNKQNM